MQCNLGPCPSNQQIKMLPQSPLIFFIKYLTNGQIGKIGQFVRGRVPLEQEPEYEIVMV